VYNAGLHIPSYILYNKKLKIKKKKKKKNKRFCEIELKKHIPNLTLTPKLPQGKKWLFNVSNRAPGR
jgi:hypothetical protein